MNKLIGGFLGGLVVSIALAEMGINGFEVELCIAICASYPFAKELFTKGKSDAE